MILKREIAEKSLLWGIPPDTVDKDWVLGHFLTAFFRITEHVERLVFKGGTCLRKCRYPEYRFSEDLDFTSTDLSFELTRNVINSAIEYIQDNSGLLMHLAELKELQYRDQLAGYQAKIKYWGANHGKNQLPPEPERWLTSIKIEVTLYEQMEFEPEHLPIIHPYSDSDTIGQIEIPCYDLREVVSEKIRSLIQRPYTAPRDLYDIWFLKDQMEDADWPIINEAFKKKTRFKGFTYTGVSQLINDKRIDILERSWIQGLGHQLQPASLPDVATVTRGLTALFQKHLTPE